MDTLSHRGRRPESSRHVVVRSAGQVEFFDPSGVHGTRARRATRALGNGLEADQLHDGDDATRLFLVLGEAGV